MRTVLHFGRIFRTFYQNKAKYHLSNKCDDIGHIQIIYLIKDQF